MRSLTLFEMTTIQQESQDTKEFLDSFKPGTQKVYRSGLIMFLKFYTETGRGKTIESFLDEIEIDMKRSRRERTRVARNVMRDFIKWLEPNYTPKTIRTYVNAVQSLAQYYGFNISAKYISLPTSQPVSTKYPWTLKEVGRFIGQMETQELKSIAATVFQCGAGIGDIMAITYGDIRREFESRVSPLCLEITRKKTDVPFMTFIGSWGLRILRKHLKNNGRDLQDSETIYSMSERTVQWHFKKLADKWLGEYKGNNPMRVHSLRSAFRTILGDAGLNETYLEFFMGHRVPEHKRVYVSKSRDGWREIYAKYEKFLDPSRKS